MTEPYRMLTARAEYRLALRADNAETRLSPIAEAHGLLSDERRAHLARRNEQRAAIARGEHDGADPDLIREAEEDARYAPYLERQADEIARMRRDAAITIAAGDALATVNGLSNEMRERLLEANPRTLDEASRIRGVTPAALTALWLHAKANA